MTEFEKQIDAVARRWTSEAKELERSIRRLQSSGERIAAQTHVNQKEAAANELRRIMQRCGVSASSGRRA